MYSYLSKVICVKANATASARNWTWHIKPIFHTDNHYTTYPLCYWPTKSCRYFFLYSNVTVTKFKFYSTLLFCLYSYHCRFYFNISAALRCVLTFVNFNICPRDLNIFLLFYAPNDTIICLYQYLLLFHWQPQKLNSQLQRTQCFYLLSYCSIRHYSSGTRIWMLV